MAYSAPPYHGGKNHPEFVTEDFLTCAICKIPGFRQPKILLCGHAFCLCCLEAWWGTGKNGLMTLPAHTRQEYSGQHGRRPVDNCCRECGMDRIGVKPHNTRCPVCCVPVKIPDGGLHALPNYVFANTQNDMLLRCHNKYPMPAIDDRRLYNISEYNHYGHTRDGCFTIQHPQWHGWTIAR